jgi:tetratricopeptide (TPR) repeat protein
MSETSPPVEEPAVPLTKIARARPRVRRAVVAGAVTVALVGALGALGGKLWCAGGKQDCLAVARTGAASVIVLVCEPEYHRTADPDVGVRLADAYRRAKNTAKASAIANGLLATPARGGALRVLGKIAESQKRYDAAVSELETARDIHRAEANHLELAKDVQALAGIHRTRGQFVQAARMLDECIREAQASGDAVIEGYCHVSAAFVLARAGSIEGAEQELDRAKPQLTEDRDRVWLIHERANLEQERLRDPVLVGHHKLAVVLFEDALRLAKRAQIPSLVISTELNLAFSLAEMRRTAEAERHVAAAAELDRDGGMASERAQVEARIAYHRDDLSLAYSLNERVYPTITDRDDKLMVCAMQAHIALASQDFASAETWARRGIEQAETLRAGQPSVEFRSWVLSSRREPYELLFTALARGGRIEEAVQVFDQWQGQALLDQMTVVDQPLDLRGAARRLEHLGAWLPAVSATPLMKTGGALVGSALRSTDALALLIADHDLWCVTSGAGQLHVVDLGPYASFKPRVDRFIGSPTGRELADELGTLLLRDAVFRTTDEPLRVVLDAPLSTLPVVALRRDGRALISARPVVRAPRLSELGCAPRPHGPRKLIALADAAGDLPDARKQAKGLTAQLGARSFVGRDATSAALFAAAPGDILDVAVHGKLDDRGGYLELYDQQVHAAEITARRFGPSVVVLSACVSGLSNRPDLTGSLALGFLAAGSSQVVATLRPVEDAGARELITGFYHRGGIDDPVRALAHVQSDLADTNNTEWPSFVVFGHEACETP